MRTKRNTEMIVSSYTA